jgi:hypothetical protein
VDAAYAAVLSDPEYIRESERITREFEGIDHATALMMDEHFGPYPIEDEPAQKAYIARQPVATPTNDNGVHEQVIFVDESGTYGVSGDFRAADADVARGFGLHLTDGIGIKLASKASLWVDTARRLREQTTLSAARQVLAKSRTTFDPVLIRRPHSRRATCSSSGSASPGQPRP